MNDNESGKYFWAKNAAQNCSKYSKNISNKNQTKQKMKVCSIIGSKLSNQFQSCIQDEFIIINNNSDF